MYTDKTTKFMFLEICSRFVVSIFVSSSDLCCDTTTSTTASVADLSYDPLEEQVLTIYISHFESFLRKKKTGKSNVAVYAFRGNVTICIKMY